MTSNDDESDSDSDCDLTFASLDMAGVQFDADPDSGLDASATTLPDWVLSSDKAICLGDFSTLLQHPEERDFENLRVLGKMLSEGDYAGALRGVSAKAMLADLPTHTTDARIATIIQERVLSMCDSSQAYLQLLLLGVAALNLFLQANYTGPSLSEDHHYDALADINPHASFAELLNAGPVLQEETKEEKITAPKRNIGFQNTVLAELAVEGEWPCQVCIHPYFLLLARSILLPLADPTRSDWSHSFTGKSHPTEFNDGDRRLTVIRGLSSKLQSARLWSARAAVAHERLLQSRSPCETLFQEVDALYAAALSSIDIGAAKSDQFAATVWLEYGLAEHFFDRPGKGKVSFLKAKEYSGLEVNVTGSMGKRTKYQQDAKAQYLVNARSTMNDHYCVEADRDPTAVKKQMVEHSEDEILLERVKFEDDKENEIKELNVLDQTILLALCLDVKNTNPSDGLTAEEMGAYLARVLDHHNNWMVFSTGLLERSWLEFERSHARERAILQMQALADQHTQRLTITQSTRESIEESAPVQDRLKMIHCLVYPPRWSMIQDLADRYAALGIVTSAAELFTDIEMWDDVVDCYRRAGKTNLAEKVVRERLEIQETPRMWSALGDLLHEPSFYTKAFDISNGRFFQAYVALGAYYFDKQELDQAALNYDAALKLRPLQPVVWFRLGTISMQLERWESALKAFSEVVQQEPEEGEAWANIAAIHLRNKHAAEAYPALVEALKYNRKSWRIWVSKLYTCLDLEKYDEAIQACNILLDLHTTNQASDGVPLVEEKCVRAIVGGTLKRFRETTNDPAGADSSHRTLSRVYELLCRISSLAGANDAWIFETLAFFHGQIEQDGKVLDYLMKEYRSLTSVQGWEKNDYNLRKVCGVVSHISHLYCAKNEKEGLTKARFLVRGVFRTIQRTRPDDTTISSELQGLEKLLTDIDQGLANI